MVGASMVLKLDSVIGGSSIERELIRYQPMTLRVGGLVSVPRGVEDAAVT